MAHQTAIVNSFIYRSNSVQNNEYSVTEANNLFTTHGKNIAATFASFVGILHQSYE